MSNSSQRSTAEHQLLLLGQYEVLGACRSDAGPCRQNNEDRVVLEIPTDAELLEGAGILALIADGMGGHEGGEVASELAVTVVPEHYYQESPSGEEPLDPNAALTDAFRAANERIFTRAAAEPALTGMGTTCTALAVRAGLAWCAHVGDSRVYLVRDRTVYCMTQDHSATMALVSQGLISLAEARYHHDRNVILRAMGTHAELEVTTWTDPFPVRTGDCFLLTSDGLHDAVSDEEIADVCSVSGTPEWICEQLISLAIEHGTTDNVSLAVLCIHPSGESADGGGGNSGDAA